MKQVITKIIGLYLNILTLVSPHKAGRMGFELFCRPFRAKITDRHREFFQSAYQFTFKHKEDIIQGYTWGSGAKRILFLHVSQSHTYRWKSYIEALDKDIFTIYAFDAPGHGLSSGKFLTVPLYGEVIKSLIDQAGSMDTIVSHSLGGFTAIYTLHENPELAPEKLIVMAPPGEAREFFDFYSKTLSLTERCLRLTISRFEEVVAQTPAYFSAPYFAKYLRSDGLLIHDEKDNETSVENSRAINRAWMKSRLIITNGKGHNLKSQSVIKEVVEFIGRPSESQAQKLYNTLIH